MGLWRQKREGELDDELRSHLEMAARERAEKGATPGEAQQAARREFGNVGLVKETTRDVWGWRWLRDAWEDARFGLRTLSKSMGFTLTAILTLALGIGANTAIFSLIDAALLKSLPVHDAESLVVPRWHAHKEPKHFTLTTYNDCGESSRQGPGGCSFSEPFFREFRRQDELFSSVAAFAGGTQLDLSGNGEAEIVQRPEYVSGDYFLTLGSVPALGRLIESGDDTPSAPPVIVLSYSYWRSYFAGDPSVIGKTVLLNKVACTIVGVAERGLDALSPANRIDLWVPLALVPQLEQPWDNREINPGNWWLVVVARLKPGVTRERAETAVNTIFINQTNGGEKPLFKREDEQAIQLESAEQGLVGRRAQVSAPLFVMFLAVGLVLLIACANVAGLLLARASGRKKEIAVRFALGASRGRVLRQLLTECFMLSAAGGILGVSLAWWCLESIVALLASSSGEALPFMPSMDLRVLLFTAAISILTGVVFGLAPALRGMRVDLTPMLNSAGRGDRQVEQRGRSVISASNALVVAQVALSIVVLAGAGLLVRTLQNLKHIDPGFDSHNVLMFSLDPTLLGYKPAECARLFDQLQNRVNGMPGVISATYSWSSLLNGWLWRSDIHPPGKPKDEQGSADVLPVGLAFFQTMKIPVVEGREFDAADLNRARAAEATVAALRAEAAARLKRGEKGPEPSKQTEKGPPIPLIVNQAFVRKYLQAVDPLGQAISPSEDADAEAPPHPGWEIVGVVGDAKYDNLQRGIEPTMYLPHSGGSVWFSLRTAGDPKSLVPSVRALVRELDSNLPVAGVRTQSEQLDRQIFKERMIARLAGFFGMLALVLACLGLYGLISYEVAQRTREIGIRTALGAARGDVLRMVLRQGMSLALLGTLLGTAIALGLLRYTKSLLFGVAATDPLTFVCVSAVLIAVMLAASYVPARRAMSVDPVVALRHE